MGARGIPAWCGHSTAAHTFLTSMVCRVSLPHLATMLDFWTQRVPAEMPMCLFLCAHTAAPSLLPRPPALPDCWLTSP